MNSSEQTTVATLAVFFALIFLLIMITMCCILRRGCRKETTQEGHKRYRFRSDWDKSGTMTSSETRITEAVGGAADNTNSQATGVNDRTASSATGALLRIEEETTAESYPKTEETLRESAEASEDGGTGKLTHFQSDDDETNCYKKQYVELNCDNEETKLIERSVHEGNSCTVNVSVLTNLDTNKNCSASASKSSKDDKHLLALGDAEFSSNCSAGESSIDLMVSAK